MKKILMSIVFSLSAFMLTACGPENNVAPTPSADATAEATIPQNTATADVSKFIGEEKAKEIALEKSEISADGVRFDRIELDRDNGIWQYEVDFKHGDMEYDVDINAETGEILSFEKEKETGF